MGAQASRDSELEQAEITLGKEVTLAARNAHADNNLSPVDCEVAIPKK